MHYYLKIKRDVSESIIVKTIGENIKIIGEKLNRSLFCNDYQDYCRHRKNSKYNNLMETKPTISLTSVPSLTSRKMFDPEQI